MARGGEASDVVRSEAVAGSDLRPRLADSVAGAAPSAVRSLWSVGRNDRLCSSRIRVAPNLMCGAVPCCSVAQIVDLTGELILVVAFVWSVDGLGSFLDRDLLVDPSSGGDPVR